MGNCFKGIYGVQKHKRIGTRHDDEKTLKTTREQTYIAVENQSNYQESQHPDFKYENLKKQKINLKIECPSISQHSELLSRMRKNQELPKSVFDDLSIRDSLFAQSNNEQASPNMYKKSSQTQLRGKSDQTSEKIKFKGHRNMSEKQDKHRQYQLSTIF